MTNQPPLQPTSSYPTPPLFSPPTQLNINNIRPTNTSPSFEKGPFLPLTPIQFTPFSPHQRPTTPFPFCPNNSSIELAQSDQFLSNFSISPLNLPSPISCQPTISANHQLMLSPSSPPTETQSSLAQIPAQPHSLLETAFSSNQIASPLLMPPRQSINTHADVTTKEAGNLETQQHHRIILNRFLSNQDLLEAGKNIETGFWYRSSQNRSAQKAVQTKECELVYSQGPINRVPLKVGSYTRWIPTKYLSLSENVPPPGIHKDKQPTPPRILSSNAAHSLSSSTFSTHPLQKKTLFASSRPPQKTKSQEKTSSKKRKTTEEITVSEAEKQKISEKESLLKIHHALILNRFKMNAQRFNRGETPSLAERTYIYQGYQADPPEKAFQEDNGRRIAHSGLKQQFPLRIGNCIRYVISKFLALYEENAKNTPTPPGARKIDRRKIQRLTPSVQTTSSSSSSTHNKFFENVHATLSADSRNSDDQEPLQSGHPTNNQP